MLLWARRNHSPLNRIPLSVVREICEYFDNRQIVDVQNNTLYFYSLERDELRELPLAIKVKKRPPLLVVNNSVYLFACGSDSNSHIENWTYRVNLEGKETRLANSVYRELESPAPLYDDDRDFFYLFGGQENSRQCTCIQIYKPSLNLWCSINARLIYARCHFTALKYKRNAYLIGGNPIESLEIYNLDTGQVRIKYLNMNIHLIQECASINNSVLMGYFYNRLVFLNVKTLIWASWMPKYKNCNPSKKWQKASKRAVMIGSSLYLLCPYPPYKFPLIISPKFGKIKE